MTMAAYLHPETSGPDLGIGNPIHLGHGGHMDIRPALEADIPGVLALQEANLFENLTDEQKAAGFVTTRYTVEQVQALIDENGLFVAHDGGAVVGYAVAASWQFLSQWPIFPHMIARLIGRDLFGTAISEANTFQYGPVCVDATRRGTDLFPRLFENMRQNLSLRYPVGLTFINRVNGRSFRAHTAKLGLEVVDEFSFSGRDYFSLGFPTSKSVLGRD
jgi:hypothetical protein